MNRAKQLKNKMEDNLPEIVAAAFTMVTVTSLVWAATCNSKLAKVYGNQVYAVERTSADEILLFLRKGEYLISKIEDIPLNTTH